MTAWHILPVNGFGAAIAGMFVLELYPDYTLTPDGIAAAAFLQHDDATKDPRDDGEYDDISDDEEV